MWRVGRLGGFLVYSLGYSGVSAGIHAVVSAILAVVILTVVVCHFGCCADPNGDCPTRVRVRACVRVITGLN